MVREYECPNCGAPMIFDSALQQMLCEHCGTAKTVETMEALKNQVNEPKTDDTVYHTGEDASLKCYTCSGCGAEIMTDEHTAATFCSFCGNPTLMEDRLSGQTMPARIIPFKINKEEAKQRYRAWCKKGMLTPKEFSSQNTIEKITGMYVPFWLYDYNANAKLSADCTKVHRERRGNMEYTHTDHYHVYRDVSDVYEKLPVDASEKMPDDVMRRLEPFSYGEMQDFNMGYLSGYMAEKYNYTSDELKRQAESRAEKYIYDEARDTINGYSSTSVRGRNIHLQCTRATYVMLPVWILNYRYKGKEYLFTLNGQTGKMDGKLPISKGKMAAWFTGITVVSYVVLTVIGGIL